MQFSTVEYNLDKSECTVDVDVDVDFDFLSLHLHYVDCENQSSAAGDICLQAVINKKVVICSSVRQTFRRPLFIWIIWICSHTHTHTES